MKKKVLLGMSGGVDSSVAAVILLEQGYDVTGVTLKLFDGDEYDAEKKSNVKTCCSLSDVEDARSVCIRLGIEHLVFNLKKEFQKSVITPFCNSYIKGETPNPCIECNRFIKWGEMLRRAEMLGFDCIATGHYARRVQVGDRFFLQKSKDVHKDQTYVLCHMTPGQISKTLLPLGEYEKSEVREIAAKHGFINAEKPDSQDICFIPDKDYVKFIADETGFVLESGNFTDTAGKVLGRHRGHICYTIGQRKGLGIALNRPMYVVKKNVQNNTVVLGEPGDLYTDVLYFRDLSTENFIGDSLHAAENHIEFPLKVQAKTRYSQKSEDALLYKDRLVFANKIRAVTAGQTVCIYDGDIVLTGGYIAENSCENSE
ncbi:MAG: tRNA 2-thiouridine(34) synthase MnmA [Ruminococcus sp.]|jgi:tRNA-specific 2-thiouridylase|nr:tRNA 2-thiouridine(34) synthase MnmA [Ruminococcus sp.]